MPVPTRAQARGAIIGAIILTLFGAAWAYGALLNRPSTPTYALFVAAIPPVGLGLISGLSFAGTGKLPPAADPDRAAREGRRMGIIFGVVFGIEGALIAIVANYLMRIGRPLLIPVWVVGIVGAHFLPLAKTFRIPIYAWTGWLLMSCALGSLLVPDEALRDFVLGCAAAIVLWVSAGIVLHRHTRSEP
jgi:hypothetical protein